MKRFSSADFGKTFVRILLTIAIIFVPFTELRFGAFGIGELSLALAFVLNVFVQAGEIRIDKYQRVFLNFWFSYIAVLIIGFAFNFFVLGYVSGTLEQAAFDIGAYLVVILFLILVADQSLFGSAGPAKYFSRIYCIWFGIYLGLYILSLTMPSIFWATASILRIFRTFGIQCSSGFDASLRTPIYWSAPSNLTMGLRWANMDNG